MNIKVGQQGFMNEAVDGDATGGAGSVGTEGALGAGTGTDVVAGSDADGDDFGADEDDGFSLDFLAQADDDIPPKREDMPPTQETGLAAPAAQVPAPVQPPVTNPPAAEPTTPPATVSEPPAAPQVDLEAVRQQAFDGLVGRWQQNLGQEVIDKLFESPAEVLPALFAQAELRAMETAMQHVMASVPQLLENYVQQQQRVSSQEETFFKEFPQLREYEADVAAAVTMLANVQGFDFTNPAVRARIAGMVMAERGLMNSPAAVAPATQAQPRPTPPPAMASRGPVSAPTQEQNPWLALLGDD